MDQEGLEYGSTAKLQGPCVALKVSAVALAWSCRPSLSSAYFPGY